MQYQQTLERTAVIEPPAESNLFHSWRWRLYFEHNLPLRQTAQVPQCLPLDEPLRAPLVRSLQRFQIGETGDGVHLKRFAAATGDQNYIKAIELFINEEKNHARLLSDVITAYGGTLLTWHWTDVVFVLLRRMCGLKTEILTLFVAEVIGRCFYEDVRDHVPDQGVSEVFAAIVQDEVAHIRFHTEFVRAAFEHVGTIKRCIFFLAWLTLFMGGCIVFVLDHRSALYALGTSPWKFLKRAVEMFTGCARRGLWFQPDPQP
jgi:hypothetical protein